MIHVTQFCEANLADVLCLAHRCGLSTTAEYLREHVLQNPSLGVHSEAISGVVVYADELCVAFQGLVSRKVYWQQRVAWGCEGTVLAIDANHAYVVGEFVEAIMKPRSHAIYYGNTCVPQTVRLLKCAGMRGAGPQTCEHIRYFVTKWGTFLDGVVKKKLRRRLPLLVKTAFDAFSGVVNLIFSRRFLTSTTTEVVKYIDPQLFDKFWEAYVEDNDGVAVSRSSVELEWLFGSGLRSGRFVVLARLADNQLVGYVVLKRQHSLIGVRWMVADWIASRNDPAILHDLLLDARAFASSSDAYCLELIGFRSDMQPVISTCLPMSRESVCNTFAYKMFDATLSIQPDDMTSRGWFWGPMDGDRCVN